MAVEASPPSPSSSSPPSGKRRSRFLTFLLFVVLPIVVLAGILLMAHAIWRGKERAAADALVEQIRARGEPITIADLADPPVPDDRNIVALLHRVEPMLVDNEEREKRKSEMESSDDSAFEPRLTNDEAALLREELSENVKALELLSGMSERDAVAWEAPPPMTSITWLLPSLNTVRQSANLLSDAAKLAAYEGRWAGALDDLLDITPLAKASARRTNLVGYLISVGSRDMIAYRLSEMAPDLDVSDPAVRDRVVRIIAELLDERVMNEEARVGYTGERAGIHEMVRAVLGRTMASAPVASMGGPIGGYLSTPLLYRADGQQLAYFTAAIGILDATSLADFRARSGPLNAIEKAVAGSNIDVFAKIFMPSLSRSFEAGFRARTDRHLAAAALAIRLYQHEHAGTRPQTFEELVPDYLPVMPIDAIDGKPLRYDVKRAILWSVGENGSDEGGDSTPKRAGYHERWMMRDAVIHLDRQARPATKPAE